MEKEQKYSLEVAFVEICVPIAKPVMQWHCSMLGFDVLGFRSAEKAGDGVNSYLLGKGHIRLIISSPAIPVSSRNAVDMERFVRKNGIAARRVGLKVDDVTSVFEEAVANGAIPIEFPGPSLHSEFDYASGSLKWYEENEICLVDRRAFSHPLFPGFEAPVHPVTGFENGFQRIDHIASELRVNEVPLWASYLSKTLGMRQVQQIEAGPENETGMILRILQTPSRQVTFVMAQPDSLDGKSKIQVNIDRFGPGIHHLAFECDDIFDTVRTLRRKGLEFVQFPAAYYALLRQNPEMKDLDLDALEELGILADKIGDAYIFQKFIKPLGDRPFFFYELVQRVNDYRGFALKNINVLKRAEEIGILQKSETDV